MDSLDLRIVDPVTGELDKHWLTGLLDWQFNDGVDIVAGGQFDYGLLPDIERGTADLLHPCVLISMQINGNEQPNCLVELTTSAKSLITSTGQGVVATWQYRSIMAWLGDTVIYPVGVLAGDVRLTGTPGAVWDALLTAAQARGCLPNWTWDFDDTTDTAGEPWVEDDTVDLVYSEGQDTYDAVRVDMVTLNVAEFRMNGFEFQIYRAGTMGQDRSVVDPDDGSPPLRYQTGRDIIEADRNLEGLIGNVQVVVGDDGRWIDRADEDSITEFGRRIERPVSAASIRSLSRLARLANLENARHSQPTAYRVYSLHVGPRTDTIGAAHPYSLFGPTPGWRVLVADDISNNGQAYVARAMAFSLSWNRVGQFGCILEVDSRYNERDERQDARIAALLTGRPGGSKPTRKDTPPAAPTDFDYISGTENPSRGPQTAYIEAAWVNATEDDDGEDLEDFDHTIVFYQVGTGKPKRVEAGTGTTARITGLPLGASGTVDIIHYDTAGNPSAALHGPFTTAAGTGDLRSTDGSGATMFRAVGGVVDVQGLITDKVLDPDTVATGNVQALAIINGKIGNSAVTGGVGGTSKIAAGTIVGGNIVARTITAGLVATNTLTANEIAAHTITAGEIAANTITAGEIAALTITASEIAADAITTTKLQADSVIADKILESISLTVAFVFAGTGSFDGIVTDEFGLAGAARGPYNISATPTTAELVSLLSAFGFANIV